MLSPYVLLILLHNDHVLLLERNGSAKFGAHHYSLIGGKVEAHESFTTAIIREAYEEVGITLEASQLHFSSTIQAHRPQEEIVAVCFVANTWSGTPYNKEPDKHMQYIWAPLTGLPDNILPINRFALTLNQAGLSYGEHGW